MSQSEGAALIELHKTQKSFTNANRNDLVKLIVLEASRRGITMYKRFNMFVAKKIAELFPGEEEEIYYQPSKQTPDGKTVPPSGKLIKRKTTVLTAMNVASPSRAKRTKLVVSESAEETIEDPKIQLEAKTWLVRGRMPEDMVKDQWNKCFSLRRKEIGAADGLAWILEQYPILVEPVGGKLISMDFDRMHPEARERFHLKFPLLHDQLRPLLEKCRMDTQNRRQFNTYSESKSIAVKDYLLCRFLPFLIQTNYKVNKDWRPTIVEVQDFFFIEVHTPSDVNEKLNKTIKHLEKYTDSKALQPHIIVVGPQESAAYKVMFGGSEYKADSVQDAISLCMSICFVLDLKYPMESTPVWEFIQTYLFGIPVKNPSKSCQKMVNLLKKSQQ